MTEMQLWTLLMEQKIDVNRYNDWIVRIKAKERMQTEPNTKGYSKVISRKRNF